MPSAPSTPEANTPSSMAEAPDDSTGVAPQKAGISGRIADHNGSALEGVTVVLTGPDAPVVSVLTQSDGRFRFPSVPTGTYELALYYANLDVESRTLAVEEGTPVQLALQIDTRAKGETIDMTPEIPIKP